MLRDPVQPMTKSCSSCLAPPTASRAWHRVQCLGNGCCILNAGPYMKAGNKLLCQSDHAMAKTGGNGWQLT